MARARLAAGALSRPLLTAAAWSSFSARGGWVFVFGSAVLAEACVLRPEQQELLVAWRARGWLPALEPGATVDSGGLVFFFGSAVLAEACVLRPEQQELLVAWRARGWLPALEPGATVDSGGLVFSSARGGAGRGLRPEQQALLVTLAGARLDAMLRC